MPGVDALTRAMARGDEAAYHAFYDTYFNRLLRYLLVVASGDEEAAREALQLTMVRVVRHVKTFETEAAFWGWLTVLARSAFTDQTRKRRRYLAFLERFTSHANVEHANRNDSQADEELRGRLEQSVALLPPDERQLIEQKYFSHRSVCEIAHELGTTNKAIESKLSRVRRKLKDAMLARLKDEQPH
jgi:RNA polymerase sigma-70 factor (ECF subfamily)